MFVGTAAARPSQAPWVTVASAACFLIVLAAEGAARVQQPRALQTVAPDPLVAAIAQLGNLDYSVRTDAARTIRRTSGSEAVPALLNAVAGDADGYVRYRSLVLLTGFSDIRIKAAMQESLASPNDRLRTVAYGYFEKNPDAAMAPLLLKALEKEAAEFVRPALIRALAALGVDSRVRAVLVRESGRGEDFFRSSVIEALGDFKAVYAVDALIAIANLEGPLVDDAALALGKVGEPRAFDTLARLRMDRVRSVQPFVAAAMCLLGTDCEPHEQFLIQTLTYSDANGGFPELMRGAAAGLGALAVEGRKSALVALFHAGLASRDPTRVRVALAVATVALRNTPVMLSALQQHASPVDAIALLAEGFDMLEEDLEKERFFVAVRRAYWEVPETSPTRALMQALIEKLDF